MRNSLFPILMTLAVALVAVLLIPDGRRAGRGGPDIAPGIFRLVKGSRGDVASMEGLAIDDRVTVQDARDERVGLEPDPWTTVVLGAEDREPVTRAVVLALAEDLTKRGVVVIVDTPEAHSLPPPLPLPSDRWLRVRTARADDIPKIPGDAFHALVRVRHGGARLPADHPAAGLQWAGGTRETTFTIEHASSLSAVRERAWPRWWAAVGRAIARDALAMIEPEIAPGAPLPADWTHRALAPWPERMPDPPNESSVGQAAASPYAHGLPVARWYACFQHDLVRGWIGRIDGTTTFDDAGAPVPAIAPLEHRLDEGKWTLVSAKDAPTRVWQRERDGKTLLFSAVSTGDGWQLACWQEWKEPAGVHEQWLDAAKAGDVVARDKLRRHLWSKALPPDQQATARELLAKGDLAERALAVDDAASHAAAAIVRRGGAVAADGALPALTRGVAIELPLAPTAQLLRVDGRPTIAVVWLVAPLRAGDDLVAQRKAVPGTAAPGVAYVHSLGATVTIADGVDAAVATAVRAKLADAAGAKPQALATVAGATVSVPVPDGSLEATCRDGTMTLTWK